MPTSDPRFPARFEADLFDEDRARSTRRGREAADAARGEYESHGVPRSHLKPCEVQGRDGTRLPKCVKSYLPHPDGKWGMVFEWVIHPTEPQLRYLAFGVRHHPRGSKAQPFMRSPTGA